MNKVKHKAKRLVERLIGDVPAPRNKALKSKEQEEIEKFNARVDSAGKEVFTSKELLKLLKGDLCGE